MWQRQLSSIASSSSSGDLPGEEGLVLAEGVQLVGRGVAPLAGRLLSGLLPVAAAAAATAAREVDVAAAEVLAGFQVGGAPRAVAVVHKDSGRQEVSVLEVEGHKAEASDPWQRATRPGARCKTKAGRAARWSERCRAAGLDLLPNQ